MPTRSSLGSACSGDFPNHETGTSVRLTSGGAPGPPPRSCTARTGARTAKQDKLRNACASRSTQSRRSRPGRQPGAGTGRQKPREMFQEERSTSHTTCRNQPLACAEWGKSLGAEINPARLPPFKRFSFCFSVASVCRAAADKPASKIKYFTISAAATSHLVSWAARGCLGNAFCRGLGWELRESLSSLLPFQSIMRVKAHTNSNQNT